MMESLYPLSFHGQDGSNENHSTHLVKKQEHKTLTIRKSVLVYQNNYGLSGFLSGICVSSLSILLVCLKYEYV